MLLDCLRITLSWLQGNYAADAPPDEQYEHSSVYSRDLVWVPIGDQASKFADSLPRAVQREWEPCPLLSSGLPRARMHGATVVNICRLCAVLLPPLPLPFQADILLAKLRPGQELDLELKCEKGIGPLAVTRSTL